VAAVAVTAVAAKTVTKAGQRRHGGGRVNRTPPFCPIMKEQHIEIEGSVKVVLPGTMFRVELDNKHLVLATISGKMRKRFVRLTVGDRVKMEMSPYDLDKARIVWRLR
jgi:translation initiation factor IF-1